MEEEIVHDLLGGYFFGENPSDVPPSGELDPNPERDSLSGTSNVTDTHVIEQDPMEIVDNPIVEPSDRGNDNIQRGDRIICLNPDSNYIFDLDDEANIESAPQEEAPQGEIISTL